MLNEGLKQNAGRRNYRFGVGAIFFMHGVCFASWASRIPAIQENLKLSASTIGIVLIALPASFVISFPIAGALIAKAGSKVSTISSALLLGLPLILLSVSANVPSLALSLFLFGFLANVLNISINTQGVVVERIYKKSLMARFHGLWSMGGFGGAAIGSWMIGQGIDPLYHFTFITMTLLLVTTFATFCLVEKDENSSVRRPMFVFPDHSLLGLGLIAFCSTIVEGAMFDWSGIYFADVIRVDPTLTGFGYTAFMISMGGTRFFTDWIYSRFGLVRLLQASGLTATVGLLVAVISPTMASSLFAFSLIGIGISSIVPTVYSAAGKTNVISPGNSVTAVSSMGFVGFLLGPPMIGLLAEVSSLRLSFLAITIMSISIVVLASRTPKLTE